MPPGYARIRVVGSFEELLTAPWADGVNALCWERRLEGDFAEVTEALAAGGESAGDDDEGLRALQLSPAGQQAREVLLTDLAGLRSAGRAPLLDCLHGYPRDEEGGPVATDVYSFHADRAPVEADTWLCTYHGACSEGLRHDEARRWVDLPEIRAALLEGFGGKDDAGFAEFLSDNCYDLHWRPEPGARPFSFGPGNLWRISIDWPGCPVPPCLHRAPETLPGQGPRLLLIS